MYIDIYVIHQKSSKIQWQGAVRHFTGVQSLSSPRLRCAEHHMKPPEATGPASGNLQRRRQSQQREEGRRLGKKASPLSFHPPTPRADITIALAPLPYLAGGVCSQCFAEGQNSQSPDCRSCYSPGGQSEFLLPAGDVEKRECSLRWQHHIFPRQVYTLSCNDPLAPADAIQNASSLIGEKCPALDRHG